MLNFDKLGAAEDVRFQQNAFDIIFFLSSHIFLTLPKNETKKKVKKMAHPITHVFPIAPSFSNTAQTNKQDLDAC